MPNPQSQSSSVESSIEEAKATPALLKIISTEPYFFKRSAVSFRVSSFHSTRAILAPD